MRCARTIGVALLSVAAVALAGCGSGASRDEGPFAYDGGAELGTADRGQTTAQGLVIRDLSFAGPDGLLEAFLVTPAGAASLPGVIYLHGAGGDRTSYLPDAIALASRGVVALTLTSPSTTRPLAGANAVERLRDYRDAVVADVVAARRAIDLLVSRSEVDPDRIGLVGWSAGARTAAILAGVEPRLAALVLLSGGAVDVDAHVAAAPVDLRDELRSTLEKVDPLRWIAEADGHRLLMQNGRRDDVVPRAALVELADAAPDGTDVRWYDAGHELDDKAFADHLAWLERRLGF